VTLPWNFDGDSFLKYVDSVNKSAKEQNYSEHAAEEEKLKQAHAENIARAREHDFDYREADIRQTPDNATELGVPLVEKHIADQYVVSQGTDDAIHTESPIHQHSTFQTDTDAAEAMDWEGFHQDPIAMGREAMQISEDQEKAFYLLQKSKHEKIMRELFEEQRDSRKMQATRRKTFGYYTGITNDRLPMRGANVKAKGTGPVKDPSK